MLFYLEKKTKNFKSWRVYRVKSICREKEMEKNWYLWRGFLKDLGEREGGGGRPNSMLLMHPCETQGPCFHLSVGWWLYSNSPVIISEVGWFKTTGEIVTLETVVSLKLPDLFSVFYGAVAMATVAHRGWALWSFWGSAVVCMECLDCFQHQSVFPAPTFYTDFLLP